jgi:hypothetical protein
MAGPARQKHMGEEGPGSLEEEVIGRVWRVFNAWLVDLVTLHVNHYALLNSEDKSEVLCHLPVLSVMWVWHSPSNAF